MYNLWLQQNKLQQFENTALDMHEMEDGTAFFARAVNYEHKMYIQSTTGQLKVVRLGKACQEKSHKD